MGSWRDRILAEFAPKVARLTLVSDPEGLLLEEGILEGIRERGFELIPFEDHVAFRYAYESKFRSRWDRGEDTDLVVVLRSQAGDLGEVPYDLLQAGRHLYFSLGDIFPNLSYQTLAALDRGDLDSLYQAQERHAPDPLGENATKEFILRHVFEIAPEFIKQPSDLLRVLLRRHHRGQLIPRTLDERLIQLLRLNHVFTEWPLDAIVPDRESFLAFLQERWPRFLDRIADDVRSAQGEMREEETHYAPRTSHFAYPGPVDLPFEHHDVRIYIDNLFLEGLLHPVPHEHAEELVKSWIGIGVQLDPSADRERRLAGLVAALQSTVPGEDARHDEWLRFARGWAELVAAACERSAESQIAREIQSLIPRVDTALVSWLSRRYAGLVNLPPVPPVMVHHLPRLLARQLAENNSLRVALLVLDGLSLDQWIVVRETIASQRPSFRFRETAVFAWVPTSTSVSRQAIFAGKPPIFFPNSIYTTGKESALWSQFWGDQGLSQYEVAYRKGLGDGSLSDIEEPLSRPRLRAVGLVIDKVDKIMHGMELGTAGMHNQVRQWSERGFLANLLDLLLDRGFTVYLTSDHGNIEALGCGSPGEGATADVREARVRVYSDGILREQVRKQFPTAIAWPPVGLPEDYLPLLAPARSAFVRVGEQITGHGGISVEELIVPLIKVERKTV